MISPDLPTLADWARGVAWRLETADGYVYASAPGDTVGDPATLGVDVVGDQDDSPPYATIRLRSSSPRLSGMSATLYLALGPKSVPVLVGVLSGVVVDETGEIIATLAPLNPARDGAHLLPDPAWIMDGTAFPAPEQGYGLGGVAEVAKGGPYPVVFGSPGPFAGAVTSAMLPVQLQARACPAYLVEDGNPSAIGVLYSRFLLTYGWIDPAVEQVYIWDNSEGRGKLIDAVRTVDKQGRPVTLADLAGDGTSVGAVTDHAYYWGFVRGYAGGAGLGSVLIYLADLAKLPIDRAAVEAARAPLDRFRIGGYLGDPVNLLTWIRAEVTPYFPVVLTTAPDGRLSWYYAPADSATPDHVAELVDVLDGGDVSFTPGYTDTPIQATEITVRFAIGDDTGAPQRSITYGPGPAPARLGDTVPVAYVVDPDLSIAAFEAGYLPMTVDVGIVWDEATAHAVARDLIARRSRMGHACACRAPWPYAPPRGGVVLLRRSRWPWAVGGARAVVTGREVGRDGIVNLTLVTL